ncbi:hypothetical protein Patl1_27299 [Pistacia atlantica]|uniref:Uncharacterized protein n=1 Tax=Pistacia atlantica TaxID=434234 RepID=A0ACC1BE31_9ROSI|nr:hypothetical protein Patl1_27299 [Pistacia atlantica]
MIYGRDDMSLEKVKSNLETREKIDKNLAINEGSNQSVGLFVDRGRANERNSNSGKSSRDWFVTYELVNGSVFLGNDHVCKVVDIGTIQIKMHDRVVRTPSDVKHIPNLQKNLISLGSLEKNGCKFKCEDGVLKFSKGALSVMKAERFGTLYFLQGSTVIGSTTVINSSSDSDNTKLWHMRLGHMSEKGMAALSKRGLLCGQQIGKLEFCEHCVFGK